MNSERNPFEYEQATTLPREFVKRVFIEDHNFTRFIQSSRNVFLVGERGSGKSMTLLYNSAAVQGVKQADGGLGYLGVYIPCNTTLTHKREYELLPDQGLASVISEHFMVLGIAYAIAQNLAYLPPDLGIEHDKGLREELSYIFEEDLDRVDDTQTTRRLMMFFQRESRRSQSGLNSLQPEKFKESAFTFSTLIIPLLRALRRLESLRSVHFLLLIDDAHDLNPYQKATLNSWIAYRDRSAFSLKVALADAYGYSYKSASGGVILEGHDFLTIDLQKPFQNADSDFGKLARDVIERRLATVNITKSAEEFFPASQDFVRAIEAFRQEAAQEAAKLYPGPGSAKQRKDYVYKYTRVKYFRERDPKANLPPYSGLDTITHVSTGVIRNLLMPCYWMYDNVISALGEQRSQPVSEIPAEVQSRVIREQSELLWRWIESSLSSSIDNCSLEDAKRIFNLLDKLGELFRWRLFHAKSEPRAIAFSISAMSEEYESQIMRVLHIARRAQLIYFRGGSAKDDGRRETYYIPNRMLWPIRGLDVVGQHARVSLKARDIWAATDGRTFPMVEETELPQAELFNED